MAKKFVHPEGGVAFPVDKKDEEALKANGWSEERPSKKQDQAPSQS